MSIEYIESLVRDVPDFPKPGILFKDITPILQDPRGFKTICDILTEQYRDQGVECVVGIESRGFLFGAPIAYNLGVGFSLVRKAGKLPWETISCSYDLEYGSATLEAHVDAVKPGQKVLIVDDLLATGGTVAATVSLLRELKADIVGAAFVMELGFLPGRKVLEDLDISVFAPLCY